MAKNALLIRPTLLPPPEPEHGTVTEVERLFGISRHLCNQKVRDGTFQSMVFRQPGSKKKVRLIYLDSVRRFIRRQQVGAQLR